MSDIARTRFRNTQRLLDEFARSRSGIEELRGIETQFAAQLGITKNYWSALKTGKRQIGAILARQFEAHFNRPVGWLDEERPGHTRIAPVGEEEWFAVGLLLSAYRADPELAKRALMQLVQDSLSPAQRDVLLPATNVSKKI